jgi:hypothetical protein
MDSLKPLLGTAVVLEGVVAYRPSGEALRIVVDSAQPAKAGDAIWARLPREETGGRSFARLGPSAAGIEAFFGRWPGDETDEQLVTALRELS